MHPEYTSLTLNGRYHTPGVLQKDCQNVISSWSAPGWQKKNYLFMQDWISPATHLEITTSGSTGAPKIMSVSKEAMAKSAIRTGEFLGLGPGDRALLCLPVDFIAGKMMVVRAFVLGLDLVTVYPASDPLQDTDDPFDFAAMTPMQVHHILEGEHGMEKLNRIGTLIIGGGDMNTQLEHQVSKLTSRVYHTYGMTETLTHVAMRELTGGLRGNVYHALPGISFRTDENNCLVISDKQLGLENLVTGDQVELISESEFRYLGRIDHVINSGGIKINPETVEGKIQDKLENRIVIAGKKDTVLGEKVVMIIELKNSGKPAALPSVIRNAALEKYEKPREAYYVDFFPESSSGKVLRKKLLERIMEINGEFIDTPE